MKKNLWVYQLIGATFTAVLGTILHFLFTWTNFRIFSYVSAVNESTWEHMKLIFIPSFLFAVIENFFLKNEFNTFWLVKLIGIVFGTLLVPVFFYTLSGIFGELSPITNVIIFYISVFGEYLLEYYLFSKLNVKIDFKWIYIGVLIFILLLFFIFTVYPPKIPLFLDPVTNGYGITK